MKRVELNLGGQTKTWVTEKRLNAGYLQIVCIDNGQRAVVCIDRQRAIVGNKEFQTLTDEQLAVFQNKAS